MAGTDFLHLGLEDSAGKTISTNFYWLSTREDELDREQAFVAARGIGKVLALGLAEAGRVD